MLLDCKKISNEIISKVSEEVSKIERKLKVVDILIGEDSSSLSYIKSKSSICKKVGIDFELKRFNINTKEEEIIDYIKSLNKDIGVDAIMIQLPISDKFNTNRIVNSISPLKDVDCLTDYNRSSNEIIPCTPKAILSILKYYNISLENKKIVLVGRGFLVGRPLYDILIENNYDVELCHSKTIELSSIIKKADILICATNESNLITKDMVNKDSIVIDAGFSYIDKEIFGNVCKNVYDSVKYITPVPGGVGLVTVASFLENILICYFKNKKM